MLKTFLHCRN